MGVVFYKVNDCCGDIETKIVDPFEIEKVGADWCLSKEKAIDAHDLRSDHIDLDFETIRCLIGELKAVILENKKLHNEMSHLEDKIDSAYIAYKEDKWPMF